MIPEPEYGEEMEKEATRDYPPVTKPEMVSCPECRGDCFLDSGDRCPWCDGEGVVKNPDLE